MAQADFMVSYKNVSSKLKKRFMKKPNFAEASEEFLKIAKTLNNDGCHAYAGLSYMAVARCEQSLMNTAGEIYQLVEAAKSFLQAHGDMDAIQCSHCKEHITSALSCCDAIIKICLSKDMPKDALSLCWKLGEWFQNNMEFDKAVVQFQKCVSLCICNSIQLVLTHKKLFKLHLQRNNFLSALNHATCMLELGKILLPSEQAGAYLSSQNQCETTVVLLILLLNPHPLHIREQHSTILQKYIWSEGQDALHHSTPCKNDDCFMLMQSLVIACSAHDISTIQKLESALRKYISVEQSFLLNKIMEEYNHHSGLGF
uniref:Factor VIII intron 22 protein n=1 Tax=Phallusia mammillata TaxID=59560 RepID=A0A6F9DBM7_9ASCI|nr:factor VIII intron 22 protein [Phallusia mammillata]